MDKLEKTSALYSEYPELLPIFADINEMLKKKRCIIAIEGRAAAGKTTLAGMIAEVYGATVFHLDDFFLRPEQRTPDRLAEIGGNVDRERFLLEVLQPLSAGKEIMYRRFDCSIRQILPPTLIIPERLVVIEGAYSMHPDLRGYYDYSIFMGIDSDTQRSRILKRNSPTLAKRFFDEWIPLENLYFSSLSIKEHCSHVYEK